MPEVEALSPAVERPSPVSAPAADALEETGPDPASAADVAPKDQQDSTLLGGIRQSLARAWPSDDASDPAQLAALSPTAPSAECPLLTNRQLADIKMTMGRKDYQMTSMLLAQALRLTLPSEDVEQGRIQYDPSLESEGLVNRSGFFGDQVFFKLGPTAFSQGVPFLVSTVLHEYRHVKQFLGRNRGQDKARGQAAADEGDSYLTELERSRQSGMFRNPSALRELLTNTIGRESAMTDEQWERLRPRVVAGLQILYQAIDAAPVSESERVAQRKLTARIKIPPLRTMKA